MPPLLATAVFSFEKIMAAIKAGKFEGKDPYGIPIIAMKDVLHTQVELGLGPLHTQFDAKPCVAYTSLYVDSMVGKWDYCQGKVLDKLSIHYNIGHLVTMEGDTVAPDGKYLVALNKLAIDRFNPVGPLHPQNHQLIDISGDKMQLLYDMPLPLGEPHYVVAIKADKLKPEVRYKSGWNSRDDAKSPFATRAGREKTERNCDAQGNCKVDIYGTVIRSHINPEIIEVDEGDTVSIHLTNLERAEDEVHGFALYGQNIQLSIEPGKTLVVRFLASGQARPDGTRTLFFELNGQPREVNVRDHSLRIVARAHPKADPAAPGQVGAPTAGMITKVSVELNQVVERQAKLITLDAMKMQSNIYAPVAGRVTKIHVALGDAVEAKDLLITITP